MTASPSQAWARALVAGALLAFAACGEGPRPPPSPPPAYTVSVAAADALAIEPYLGQNELNLGRFVLTRDGPVDSDLTVFVSSGGRATERVDYDPLPTSVVIPAGSRTAEVVVTPLPDDYAEGDETVELAIRPSNTYAVVASGRATVVIVDEDSRDPDLEPGFPVTTLPLSGSYFGGAAVATLVADVDGDLGLEIVVSGLGSGPLYAWHADGSPVPGWPLPDLVGVGYPAAGELSVGRPGLEVVAGYYGDTIPGRIAVYGDGGVPLPGWPLLTQMITAPPALADVDGDGVDEIFTDGDGNCLHAYRAEASELPGWPACGGGNWRRTTPAIADLDGDGDLEIATLDAVNLLSVYHHDGSPVAGFPVTLDGYCMDAPVIGDVDGDGKPELVVVCGSVRILAADGTQKRAIPTAGWLFYGTSPALADLDGDCTPEIVVQTNGAVDVFRGDGSSLEGWPVRYLENQDMYSTAPVVGDVDGDGEPDILVAGWTSGEMFGELRLYDRRGVLHPRFPKTIPFGLGMTPAIADVDLDGRNEIVVWGDDTSGFDYARLWVYDLGGGPHGTIQWGQYMGGPRHQGAYRCP